jgi:hypothetical protein
MKPNFEEYSWFDENGGLLKIRDDCNYIYRAVSADSFDIFRNLSQMGSMPALFQCGLIKTEVTSLEVEGYAGVLRHRRIPFVSEPNEWTMRMLKEAGLVICKLALELDKLGYGLQDAHPWNISFDRIRPFFLDWGSIIHNHEVSKKAWLLEYRQHIFLPLWLFSKGFKTLAYESLWERRGGSAKYVFNHRRLRVFPGSGIQGILKSCSEKFINPRCGIQSWRLFNCLQ